MSMPESATKRWEETENLLNRIENHTAESIKPADVLRLGELYTELISDLNKLTVAIDDPPARARVNRLALRAYGTIYQKKPMTFGELVNFFIFGFPRLVRRRIHFVIASALLFITAALVGYLCIHEKSRLVDLAVPPVEQQRLKSLAMAARPNEPHPLAREGNFGLSSSIMVNNIRVSILAFATGIFLGIGTIIILIKNGLMLGAMAALYTDAGYARYFWSLILPHGGIELICIFIGGAAGFIVGYSLINPGSYRRKDWVVKEGHDAVKLVIGSIPLLVLAALIEAYITPAFLSPDHKLGLSAIFFLLLVAWLTAGAHADQS
ncbi:MAG: stage II sporulation protein M [Candidatus Riflebacteria bacterium]|nr:stage II sporulation protein M [Candidatus Riflebacteria bacterium]